MDGLLGGRGGEGGQRVCWPPSQIIGGAWPPPSSYAYAATHSSAIALLYIRTSEQKMLENYRL